MGFWYRKTILEKRLIISTVLFVLLSIGLLIGLIVAANKNKSDYNDSGDVCESVECLIAASELQNSVNLTADPCEDFYEYACGGWMKKNIIGPDRSRWSQFDVTRKRLLDKVRVLLEAKINSSSPPIIGQSIGLYKQCMDIKKRDLDGHVELLELIRSIGWPMINKNEAPYPYSWPRVFARLNREHGFNFILSNYVYLDAKNTTFYSIYVDAPSFGVGRAQLVKPEDENNKKIITAYKKFISDAVYLLADSSTISASLDRDIEKLVDFEQRLANITADNASRRNRTELYGTKTTLGQFAQDYGGFQLTGVEREVFQGLGLTISDDSPLIVYDREYFKRLVGVLSVTDEETLANYLSWRTVRSLGGYTTKAFRTIEFEFNKVVSGVEEQKALWEECVETVNNRLTFAVGRLYVDENFSGEGKEDMGQMIDQLNEAFRQLLNDNDWMEKQTKDKALNKLEKMLRAIAYPEFILIDEKLNDYYKDLTLDTTKTFFNSIQANNLWSNQKSMKKLPTLNENREELEWSTGPAIVNAFFSPNINRITFPAGILQSPFYTFGLPVALNLGAIGVVIGHEITHSFDDSGSQYDEYGNLVNWWDDKTKVEFSKKVKCFIDQYTGYNDSLAERPINGSTTIGENIADNGGLRQAFRALENYSGRKQILPASMKSFTNEQLFFLSFANVWCTNIRKEALINQIETDPHSPGKYRVWGSVSNSESFAKAFNCKKTNMNPESKCILW